ncbi:hypothetical protein [Algoriphagus sp.]|uniref:hypothetical protein n=1 Tax=Algoriphagus sp. TaxID=1872435 RepID=UPI002636911F|nr:hypothetical protein [Algoriphagus sp.]
MANDELIRDFFLKMKAGDQRIPTPEFPEVKTGGFNWWIPLGIAATLLLGGFFLMNEPVPEPPADLIIISLQENENQEQQLIIEEKAFIDTWESTTSSLLTDF